MKHGMGWRRAFGLATVVAFGLAGAVLSGCSGGGNVLGGSTVTGTFTGASANLGAGKAGTFQLQTRSDNTVNGTLTVTAQAADKKISAAAVSLPSGTYNFSGTRSGNNFNASGHFDGTPAFDFNISGTLSTSSTAGSWTISGSINGESFSFNGAINVTTGGGGGGGGGDATFTISANTSNAISSTFTSIANVGTSVVVGNEHLLNASFTQATSAANTRLLTVSFTKTSAFAVNDTFSLSDSAVGYSEGAPPTKMWLSQGGTGKITAISGNHYTVQITNAAMQPAAFGLPGQVNNASGNFTLNGSGTVVITAN